MAKYCNPPEADKSAKSKVFADVPAVALLRLRHRQKSRIQNPESRIQNPESRIQNQILTQIQFYVLMDVSLYSARLKIQL